MNCAEERGQKYIFKKCLYKRGRQINEAPRMGYFDISVITLGKWKYGIRSLKFQLLKWLS